MVRTLSTEETLPDVMVRFLNTRPCSEFLKFRAFVKLLSKQHTIQIRKEVPYLQLLKVSLI